MSQEQWAGVLSTAAAVIILVAGYFQQIRVGYGGDNTELRPWVKFGLYPVVGMLLVVSCVLLVAS